MKTGRRSRTGNSFPDIRLRRLRTTSAIRDLMQETRLSAKDLIAPIFVQEGSKKPATIRSMPDVQRLPLTKLVGEVEETLHLGIRAIAQDKAQGAHENGFPRSRFPGDDIQAFVETNLRLVNDRVIFYG